MEMIAKLYLCRKCESQNIVKNGHNASGSQQYKCKDCGAHGVLEPRYSYTEEEREQIINDYYERSSMRGIQRVFGVSRPILWNAGTIRCDNPMLGMLERLCLSLKTIYTMRLLHASTLFAITYHL